MTPGQWSLLSPCPQKQKTTKNKKQGHIAPDNIAPRVIRALKPLHHVKVAVQGGVKNRTIMFKKSSGFNIHF